MASSPPPNAWQRRLAIFAWISLAYTQLVILWGAYVRVAGAGSGCGDNWPLCDGQFLPRSPGLKMLIEFLHRASSGVDAVLVVGVLAAALWIYPKRHRVRRAAGAAAGFMVVEALLGAALVLFGWVGTNASAARVAADGLHLVNTMLLLAAVLLTALFASGMRLEAAPARRTRVLLGIGLAAVLVTAVCGVMAALADTLYPATSLAAGMRLDFTAGTPWLEHLRVLHPAIAVVTGLYLLYLIADGLPQPATATARRLGYGVMAAVVVQWGLGAADLLRLTPAALQILHLLGADVLWMTLAGYSASLFNRSENPGAMVA